jgi:hypothetical protein
MHLNGGYTRVVLERTFGLGLADGGIEWDIPTDIIPTHLRRIGSRFILISNNPKPDESDDIDALRQTISNVTVEEF